jgi:hypothetical protein
LVKAAIGTTWSASVGTMADAFVEHFWACADLGRGNDVDRRKAVYVVRA